MKQRIVFWKIKIDNPLAKPTKEKEKDWNIQMKKETLALKSQKHKGLWDHFESSYANKMDDLEEMEKILNMYNPSKLENEGTENWIDQ